MVIFMMVTGKMINSMVMENIDSRINLTTRVNLKMAYITVKGPLVMQMAVCMMVIGLKIKNKDQENSYLQIRVK